MLPVGMTPTSAMDARGNTKRSRVAVDQTTEAMTAWQRIVMKVLLVVAKMTDMMAWQGWPGLSTRSRNAPGRDLLQDCRGGGTGQLGGGLHGRPRGRGHPPEPALHDQLWCTDISGFQHERLSRVCQVRINKYHHINERPPQPQNLPILFSIRAKITLSIVTNTIKLINLFGDGDFA